VKAVKVMLKDVSVLSSSHTPWNRTDGVQVNLAIYRLPYLEEVTVISTLPASYFVVQSETI
jgi:hypothetical protein